MSKHHRYYLDKMYMIIMLGGGWRNKTSSGSVVLALARGGCDLGEELSVRLVSDHLSTTSVKE